MIDTCPTLNLVGCGKLGTTLARLLWNAKAVRIAGLYSRTADKVALARAFIGAGQPAACLADLPPADIWLLAVSDDNIAAVAAQLVAQRSDWQGITVFHASGLHTSSLLEPLAQAGALTASLHPAHSFGDREKSLVTFAGSCCTQEGHPAALTQLNTVFASLDLQMLEIEATAKPLYHAATVMASNYVVSLLGASLELLRAAGIPHREASTLLAPLAHQTADNVFAHGAAQALTGPIVRGDRTTLATHLAAIDTSASDILALYRSLGRATLDLAAGNGNLDAARIAELEQLLAEPTLPLP